MSFQDIGKLTENRANTLAFSEEDINKILLQFSNESSFLEVDSNIDLKRKFEYLLKRQTNSRLHATTLAEYLKVRRIPRGLRILLKPTLCKDSEDFISKWRMILNKCSLDLIALTIQELQRTLVDIEKEIDTTKVSLESSMNGEEWSNTVKELELSLNKHREEIEQVKIRKFRRDTQDYKLNIVYTWYENLDPSNRRRFQTRQFGASGSSSDPGSLSDEDQGIRVGDHQQPSSSGLSVTTPAHTIGTPFGHSSATSSSSFLSRGPRGGRPGGGGKGRGSYPVTRSQRNL